MITATNTCPVNTVLQLLYCIWAQHLIPHQIIENFVPILSKSLSLIKEGNHAYVRALFTNDAAERKEEVLDRLLKKDIVENQDRLDTAYWNYWSDFWHYTQDDSKLFKTDAIRREYSYCELGPECPDYQNFVKKHERLK